MEKILECVECKVEGTWEGGSSRGNLFHCEHSSGCDNIVCYDCLVEKGLHQEGIPIMCPDCLSETLNELSLTKEELIELLRLDKFPLSEIIDMKKENDIKVFESRDNYLAWLNNEDGSQFDFICTLLGYKKEDIQDGETLFDAVMRNDSRVVELSSNKCIYFYC